MRSLLSFIALFFAYLPAKSQNNIKISGPIAATPGAENIFIGVTAGSNNTTGAENIFIGNYYTGFSNTVGRENVFVGSGTGSANLSGTWNTFMGVAAGRENTTGITNSFIGAYAGQWNKQGNDNSFLGFFAGHTSLGSGNTFIGVSAGRNNEKANNNVMIGTVTGYNNRASDNTFIGFGAGFNNVEGIRNTLIGFQSGYNTLSPSNTFVGYQSGLANKSGSANTFIGESAGRISEGYGNTFIGAGADVLTPSLFQAVAIGYNAKVSISNAIVLGDTTSGVKVGIGTTAPQFPLDVKGTINIRGAGGKLKFTHLTNPKFNPAGNDQLLTVNDQGEVTLTKYRLRIAQPTEWSDRVFSSSYTLAPLEQVEQFINTHQHLPGIPSAEDVAENGVDATQFNAKLLEKIEELTLYMIQFKKENDALKKTVATLKEQNETLRTQIRNRQSEK